MRKYQEVLTVKREDGKISTGRYSFKYLEKAIEDSLKIKDKIIGSGGQVIAIKVIDKDTDETKWSWEA